ncbi:hypothetical protein MJO28_014240 [Puccinia striiformis f. sp. tritici]|uniref:Uncharacterized protein n=1 Tax=Puccinia striiformis f. sp. tritici TaxID=168172 RepID=A0ACC0DU45_9BASI|nr:hypothetical protein MJO28_014240 [Puccinia striiformis f. sp. tritici]KAI7939368.1 hypothetical protein MJO29_014104 [Puccinia striiformis f. sp. tritici]
MNLTRRTDDLDNNKVDLNTVVSCVKVIHQTPEGRNAGYRKLRQLLHTKYGLYIQNNIPLLISPSITVAMINKSLDPDRVQARSKRVLKRRVFNTRPGPNHIWSTNGHDKLKKFGITLYGFMDVWSRKILGIFVHITNNDPRHTGYYYLQLVKSQGGIPRRMTTDRGTETIHMAGHQINLTKQYNIECPDPTTSHHFTKSTHNQKIECLWSQLMRQYNCELINQLYEADEKKYYHPEDRFYLSTYGYHYSKWTSNYNNYKQQWDPKSMLPTKCSAQWAYEYPKEVGGEQGLIPVPASAANTLEQEFYPEGTGILQTSPTWFLEAINELKTNMNLQIPSPDIHNVWDIFAQLLRAIQAFDSTWLSDPTNDPSECFHHRASLFS